MNRRQILENIPIDKINILNPRERNRKIASEIKKNIEDVGLKRPITVSRRLDFTDGKEYDLVCGQGRLEAYIANNQTEIPAIIIDADEEETLIMSLVENIARRNYYCFRESNSSRTKDIPRPRLPAKQALQQNISTKSASCCFGGKNA